MLFHLQDEAGSLQTFKLLFNRSRLGLRFKNFLGDRELIHNWDDAFRHFQTREVRGLPSEQLFLTELQQGLTYSDRLALELIS